MPYLTLEANKISIFVPQCRGPWSNDGATELGQSVIVIQIEQSTLYSRVDHRTIDCWSLRPTVLTSDNPMPTDQTTLYTKMSNVGKRELVRRWMLHRHRFGPTPCMIGMGLSDPFSSVRMNSMENRKDRAPVGITWNRWPFRCHFPTHSRESIISSRRVVWWITRKVTLLRQYSINLHDTGGSN